MRSFQLPGFANGLARVARMLPDRGIIIGGIAWPADMKARETH